MAHTKDSTGLGGKKAFSTAPKDGSQPVRFPGLAEHADIYELIQERKDRAAVHSLDDILAEEGLSRADLEG